MEKKSYDWFEQRRKTRGLELAHEQITKAFDTVTWLHKATKSFSEKNFKEPKNTLKTSTKLKKKLTSFEQTFSWSYPKVQLWLLITEKTYCILLNG